MSEVKEYLKKQGIICKVFKHPPLFTCEQAKKDPTYHQIQGIHSKNLFLKKRNAKRFFLYILPEDKKADLKTLELFVKEKIKFANEKELLEKLNLTPGAVSPFGLLNNITHDVEVIIDEEVWNADKVSFHPNINTETLELSKKNFHKYIQTIGNKYSILKS